MSFDSIHKGLVKCDDSRASVLTSLLSTDKNALEHFYLSGYEGLCLSMDHRRMTEAVISSAVPMDGELLVIGGDAACALWRDVCAKLSIRLSALDIDDENLLRAVETILMVNPRISHILCTTSCGSEKLKEISALARTYHCAVILDSETDTLTMEDIEKAGVDFVLSASTDSEEPVGVLVARRSKLVMTEGNARSFEHDIYALWQDSMANRTPALMPMA